MTTADTAPTRPSRLLYMDAALWKEEVKERADADGLARARSRILEALLDGYARGALSVAASDSTRGAVQRADCRAYLPPALCEKAEARWKRENPKVYGNGGSFSLLCELLLREYADGRAILRITAEPTENAGSEAA